MGASLLFLFCVAQGRAASGSAIVAQACARTESLRNYTFHADVAMTMRHFPWLHFHISGIGTYDRDTGRYGIHFTKMPWFASKIHDIDLSMIDPNLWSGHYSYQAIEQRGRDTVFSLHALDDDSIKVATVALDPASGDADWVDVTYSDGTHIHMNVGKSSVAGFELPANLTASVDYSKMPLSADASLTQYTFSGT
jgi:hypothetical protein